MGDLQVKKGVAAESGVIRKRKVDLVTFKDKRRFVPLSSHNFVHELLSPHELGVGLQVVHIVR